MLSRSITASALCALLIASCGPKALALPEDPLERAAMCGAVAAASARSKTDINSPLPLEKIGGVLHYPLLAASSGETYSPDTAAKVQQRMAELQDRVVESKWQELVPACREAFPATAVEEVSLPEGRFEAQLGCDELGDFLRSSLEAQDEYMNELGEYRQLSNRLDPVLAGGADPDRRSKALAAMAKAGPPVAVMRKCLERFG